MELTLTEHETALPQRLLVAQAVFQARRAGYDVRIDTIGSDPDTAHATLEIPMAGGRHLVLHPMGEALGLCWEDVADEEADIDV